MKLIILCVLIFVSARGQAEESDVLGQVFYNIEGRYERNEEQGWEMRMPLSLSLGLRKDKWGVLLDYSQWSVSTGNASLSTDLKNQEAILWAQYDLTTLNWVSGLPMYFYFGAGAGGLQKEVTTNLLGSSTADKSKVLGILGFGVGLQSRFFVFSSLPRLGFAFGLEGRFLFSQEYDPNPQGAALLRLGVLF